MTNLVAYAPDGTLIVGQLNTIPRAVARIAYFNEARADDDGLITFEGYTDVNWDSQEAVIRDGERVYVDEDGDEWLASQLTFKAEEE